jgi:hypothetical protein
LNCEMICDVMRRCSPDTESFPYVVGDAHHRQ